MPRTRSRTGSLKATNPYRNDVSLEKKKMKIRGDSARGFLAALLRRKKPIIFFIEARKFWELHSYDSSYNTGYITYAGNRGSLWTEWSDHDDSFPSRQKMGYFL